MKNSVKFSASMFGLVLVLAFFPFVTVSCAGEKVMTLNGYQVATGATIEEEGSYSEAKRSDPAPSVAITYIVAILGLIFAISRKIMPSAALAGLGSILLLIHKSNWTGKAAEAGIGLKYEIAYWLSLLALLAVAVVNGFDWYQNYSNNSNDSRIETGFD